MKRPRPYKPMRNGSGKRPRVGAAPPIARRAYLRNRDVEYKVTDTLLNNGMMNAILPGGGAGSTFVQSVTGSIARGDGIINAFDGAKIFPVGLEFRAAATLPTAIPFMSCRVMLVQWNSTGVPSSNDILEYTGVIGTGTGALVFSPKKIENRSNMTILWDKSFTINNYDAATAQYSFQLKKYIKGFKMSEITFASASTVPVKGGIYLCAWANTANGAASPIIQGHTRLTYSD